MTDTRTDSPRIHAIDLARGLAVLLMIGAHGADAFLADRFKEGTLWYAIDLLFGYVAPAFTFLGGVTLRQALDRGMASGIPPGTTAGRFARRYLTILLLGYWLQTPVLSLRQLVWVRDPLLLARLFDANILQVIAVAGLLALLVTRMARSTERARLPLLLLALAGIAATPYIWSNGLFMELPLPLRFYLAPHPPATFPLLPYGSYLLLGFLAAEPLLRLGARRRVRMLMPAVGGALTLAGLALDPLLHGHPPHDDFWRSSIQHVIFRLGGIVAAVSLCFVIPERRMAWLAYAGRRSLAIYVLHLMLIYGSPMTMGGRYWLGGLLDRSLDPAGAIAASVAVFLLCYLGIRWWEILRRKRPVAALWGKRVWWGAFWAFFLFTP